jgi:uncharacterized protein with FMN-binding domain
MHDVKSKTYKQAKQTKRTQQNIKKPISKKKTNTWKYIAGFVTIAIVAIGSFVYFNPFDNKQEIPQSLTLQTTTEENIIIDNKSSLSLPFITNQGQTNEEVKYYAPIFTGTMFVTDNSLTYTLKKEQQKLAFKETFLNYDGEEIQLNPIGQNKSQTKTSYFTNSNQYSDVETNNSVYLGELYNRISISLRAYKDNVEKLFIVESGGNPNEISLKLEGVDELNISQTGELEVKIGEQNISFTKPIAYQEITKDNQTKKQYIATNYTIKDDNTYGFEVAKYDTSKPLIIDPLISSTYIGGTQDENYGYDDFGGKIYTGHNSMAKDSSDNIYIVSQTQSDDYPTTLGVIDDTYNDAGATLPNDIVVSKFNSDLSQLLASTYIGGTSEENASSILIDGNDIYITGFTRSNDYPTTSGVHDTTFNGGNSDIFVTKLNTDLTQLISSTFIGGTDKEFGYSIVKDGSTLYLAGDTYSTNFPTRQGAYDSQLDGASDGFILTITDDLTTINNTTFIGGTDADYTRKIQIDSSNNIVVAGHTNSTDFPVSGYDTTHNGQTDAYVAIFSQDLSTLTTSTFVGGALTDTLASFAIDSSNNIIITGNTNSTDFPVQNAYQSTQAGDYDAFVTKLSSDLTTLQNSTYLGGTSQEDIYEISLDNNQNIYIAGTTRSSDYPVSQYAWDKTLSGVSDACISRLSNDLTTLQNSTYFGGDGNTDYILSITHTDDSDNDVLVRGITDSNNLPTTSNAYDQTYNGGRDIFVSKLTNDLRADAWPDHLTITDDNENNSINATAGNSQIITISVKDPFDRDVQTLNGDYTVRLEGAANAPHNNLATHNMEPTCNGVLLGDDMTLTFTNGKATCNLILYAQEITSIDGEADIDTITYTSQNSPDDDLDATVIHNNLSETGTSIDAQFNPTIVTDNVTITVIANDEYGNPLGNDGVGQNVSLTVTGTNPNTPSVTDNNDGTYTASYTSSQTIGNDQISGTINSNTIGWDEDGTPDGTFNLPINSKSTTHLTLRYEYPTDTLNDSLNTQAGTAVTLVIQAKDEYNNNVTNYDGYHYITITPSNTSPYGNRPTCGTTILGNQTYLHFTDGQAKCTLTMYNSETIELEATDGTYDTTSSPDYDLDVTITPNSLNHLRIDGNTTQTAGTNQTVTITAKDIYGNTRTDYTGNHNITFSGANPSRNNTNPTATDNSSNPIQFTNQTTLTFTNGQTQSQMTLYNREFAEIEITDGTYDSTGSDDFDLNVQVSSTGIATAQETTIDVSQDPAGTCGATGVFVIARDTYGNQLETGGNTITINVAGTNPNTPSVTDNNDGSYVGTYNPTNGGVDQITGTIDTQAIQKDEDGTSDGTYNLTVTPGTGNTRHWDGSDSTDWHTPANWQENLVPDECSTVELDGNIASLATYYEPTLDVSTGTERIAALNVGLATDPNATPTTLTLSNANETNNLYVANDVHIGGQGTLTHTQNSTTQQHTLNLEIGGDFTMDASSEINVDEKGLRGVYDARNANPGGSYGGLGGSEVEGNTYDNNIYGSITNPNLLGKGGHGAWGAPYIFGGGVINLDIQGNAQIDGTITSSGILRYGSSYWGGGNSGGSILMNVNQLNGNGLIKANGSSSASPWNGNGGGGSGGRIAIYYENSLFNGDITSYGGDKLTKAQHGAAGTIYLKDKNEQYGQLIIDNNNQNGNITPQYTKYTDQLNQEMTYSHIDIRGYGKYEVNDEAVLNLPNTTEISGDNNGYLINSGTITFPQETTLWNVPLNSLTNTGTLQGIRDLTVTDGTNLYHDANGSLDILENLTISNGSTVELSNYSLSTPLNLNNLTIENGGTLTHTQNDTTQDSVLNILANNLTIDSGGQINTNAKGYNSDQGHGVGTGTSGAGYGGIGGAGNTGTPGSSYGQETNPIDIGSGGGNAGGRGGGMLKAQIYDTLTINGDILAEGQNASGSNRGGGAGGSVLLTTNHFNGTGFISANGGDDSGSGGGGAGGRIAVYYQDENFISSGGSITTPGNIEDPIGGTNGNLGTLYLAYPDHYQITGNNTQTAGTNQSINISLVDNNGNPFIYTGDKTFTFLGANPSSTGPVFSNGTQPTCSDKNSNNINFGDPTTLTLTDGVTTSSMFLYNAENAEIETTDGQFSTFNNQNYDLDVVVSSDTPDESQTSIEVTPNPSPVGNQVNITVTSKDIWGNQVTIGGDIITLTVSGANSLNPSVTDNNDGTYTASYTPTNIGQDQITGTINGNVITHDTDGTSDGIFNENITGASATHLEITGNNTQQAGTPQTITITAKDNGGNIDYTYSGDIQITLSGPSNAPDNTVPTCRDKDGIDVELTNPTTLTFTNGQATCQLYLYNKEQTSIDATDGIIDSNGDDSYDLDVDVTQADIDYNESILSALPNPVQTNDTTTITVTTYDTYQNQLSTGGNTVQIDIAGDNPQTPSVTDNNDGTYTATHTPTVTGQDQITGTVDSNNITQDTDGTSDGTFHLTIGTTPTYLEISGSDTQTAGTNQTITISARDDAGQIAIAYSGDKQITLSGPLNAPDGTIPTCTDNTNTPIELTNPTTLTFTNGQATCELSLYKKETTQVDATDTIIDTQGDDSYDLDIDILPAQACGGDVTANPTTLKAFEQVDIELNNITDSYQNQITTGGDNVEMEITGSNPQTLNTTDNNNATYTSNYIPTNTGTDTLNTTLNSCTLNTVEITIQQADEPVCGSASKNYTYNQTNFEGDFCQTGTIDTTPNFPNQGEEVTWNCVNNNRRR